MKKNVFCITVIFVFLFFLSGCRKIESQRNIDLNQNYGVKNEFKIGPAQNFLGTGIFVTGENAYLQDYSENRESEGIFTINTNNGKKERTEIQGLSEKEYVLCICAKDDEELYALSRDYENDSIFVLRISKQGKVTERIPADEGLQYRENMLLPAGISADSSGDIICRFLDKIVVLSPDGSGKQSYPYKDGILNRAFTDTDDMLFTLSFGGMGEPCLERIDINTGRRKKYDDIPGDIKGIGVSDEEHILLFDSNMLYSLDKTSGNVAVVTSWEETGINGESVVYADSCSDGFVVIEVDEYSGETGLIILSTDYEENTKVKNEITIGVLYPNDSLKYAVSNYNKSGSGYNILLRNYMEGINRVNETEEDVNNAVSKMFMDMLGNDGPDIIDLASLYCYDNGFDIGTGIMADMPSVKDMLSKGYVIDLNPYIDKSENINLDDYEEKALGLYRCDKSIAAIPYSFSLFSMIVNSEDYGDCSGWTIYDLMEYDSQNPDIPLVGECNKNMVLQVCLFPCIGEYVYNHDGEAFIDSEAIRDILLYADSYPDGKENYNRYSYGGLVRTVWIQKPDEIQSFNNLRFEGNVNYIGFPTKTGKPKTFILADGKKSSLAICGSSKQKDAAWDFIEYYLNNNYYDADENKVFSDSRYNYMTGIPSNRSLLEKYMKYLGSENSPLHGEEGTGDPGKGYFVTYTRYPLSGEEQEKLYELIEVAEPFDNRNTPVIEIIEEEVGPFFSGQRDIDVTMDVIQNRVNLFLSENIGN